MANAIFQALAGLSQETYPQAIPALANGAGSYIYAPDYRASVLDASNNQVGYLGDIEKILDLGVNANHLLATGVPRCKYLRVTPEHGPYIYHNKAASASTPPRVPYSAVMDIPNDMTLTIKVAQEVWPPAIDTVLMSRDLRWIFVSNANGTVSLVRYPGFVGVSWTSTAALPAFSANQPVTLRAKYVNNTGSGQYSVIFEYSLDGTNFIQLGSTFTGASAASIPTGGAIVIGGYEFVYTYRVLGRIFSWAVGDATTTILAWNGTGSHGSQSIACSTGGLSMALIQPYAYIKHSSVLWVAGAGFAPTVAIVPAANNHNSGLGYIGIGSEVVSTFTIPGGGFPSAIVCSGSNTYTADSTGYLGSTNSGAMKFKYVTGRRGAGSITVVVDGSTLTGLNAGAFPGNFTVFGPVNSDGIIMNRSYYQPTSGTLPLAGQAVPWLQAGLTN